MEQSAGTPSSGTYVLLAVRDTVRALQDFDTDSDSHISIKGGTFGIVKGIDADGNAFIKWEGVDDEEWLFMENLYKINVEEKAETYHICELAQRRGNGENDTGVQPVVMMGYAAVPVGMDGSYVGAPSSGAGWSGGQAVPGGGRSKMDNDLFSEQVGPELSAEDSAALHTSPASAGGGSLARQKAPHGTHNTVAGAGSAADGRSPGNADKLMEADGHPSWAWFAGTTWKEDAAVEYKVEASPTGGKGDYTVSKLVRDRRKFDVPLFIGGRDGHLEEGNPSDAKVSASKIRFGRRASRYRTRCKKRLNTAAEG